MIFKDLKCGDTIYIYDRTAFTLTTDKVASVSAPHFDPRNVSRMIVDVAVGSVDMTYQFNESAEIGYYQNLVLSPNGVMILREVETQRANSVSNFERLKAEIPKLDAIIETLSPEKKESRQTEERVSKIEESVGEMRESIGSMKEMIELLIKQKNGSK